MKQSKILYFITILITLSVAVLTFTTLPKEITFGSETKPSYYLILLSILPLFSTLLCMEVKSYNVLGHLLFIIINFILLRTILIQFGHVIPMTLVGGLCLVLGSFFIGFHLRGVSKREKLAINLAWITTEEGYLAVQKKGARVFFIYSLLQALTLILYFLDIISVNLAFIIPLATFALSIAVMLKIAVKLE